MSKCFSGFSSLIEAGFSTAGSPGGALRLVSLHKVVETVSFGELAADSIVVLGSTSKSLTAIALFQAIEAGLLALTDPVHRWLPDANIPVDITVRDLAHHCSGLKPDSTPEHYRWVKSRTFRYANQNYNLLGQVIAKATEVPFEQWLSERIFIPLKLKDTFCYEQSREIEIVAGHTGFFGYLKRTAVKDYGPTSWIQPGSGAVCSSAADTGRILRMLLNGGELDGVRILSAESVQTMLQDTVPTEGSPATSGPLGAADSYGFGWVCKSLDGEEIFLHTGKVPNYTTAFVLLPQRKIGFSLVANMGDFLIGTPLFEDLVEGIIRTLLGYEAAPPNPQKRKIRRTALLAACFGIAGLGALGWLPKLPGGRAGAVGYHLILPAGLVLGIRYSSGSPYRWIWRFSPDIATVLGTSAASMFTSGAWKILRKSK